jgi:hypothetical protein
MVSSNSYAAAMQRSNLIRQSEEIIPSSIDVGTIASSAIVNNKSTNEDNYKNPQQEKKRFWECSGDTPMFKIHFSTRIYQFFGICQK